MMKPIALLLALALPLAGCLGESDEGDGTPLEEEGQGGPSNEEPQNDTPDPVDDTPTCDSVDGPTRDGPDGCPVANSDPVAGIVASKMTGEVPFDVTFDLTGSDADNDTLSWTLDADGDGSADTQGESLPANFTFSYAAEGLYNVTFTVTDGDGTAVAGLEINATGAVEEAGGFVPFIVTLNMIEGCELCVDGGQNSQGCVGFHLGVNEIDCGWVEIPPEAWGLPFSVYAELTGPLTAANGIDASPDIEWYDSCSAGGTSVGTDIDGNHDIPTVKGTIPEGAGCLIIFEFHWPNLGHMFEVSIGENIH